MRESDTDKPRRGIKAVGVFLATCIAVAALVMVAITQEPKNAVSSPGPAKAAIVPQIADAKSEAELHFRGKSFFLFKRSVVFPYSGEILKIDVSEGQSVKEDDTLASYKLDRESMNTVHSILYPEALLNLRKIAFDQRTAIDKMKNVDIETKRLEVQKLEKELADLKDLAARRMASDEAVKNKERQIQVTLKEIEGIKESIKQTEAGLEKTQEDLKFHEAKRKRDVELLEWQTHRSYSDTNVPMNMAFLKAPIEGQIMWMSADLRERAEVPRGFTAMSLAPLSTMVVRCKAHELELVKLKTGDRGTVTFDAIQGRKFPCKVSRIPWVSRNPALEVPADFEIECALDDPDGKIKDGLTCNVKVSIAQ